MTGELKEFLRTGSKVRNKLRHHHEGGVGVPQVANSVKLPPGYAFVPEFMNKVGIDQEYYFESTELKKLWSKYFKKRSEILLKSNGKPGNGYLPNTRFQSVVQKFFHDPAKLRLSYSSSPSYSKDGRQTPPSTWTPTCLSFKIHPSRKRYPLRD